MTIEWSPISSPAILSILAAALLLPPVIAIVMRVKGAVWRFIGAALVLLALFGPSFIEEQKTPLKTVIAVIVDRSSSQDIGDRRKQTDDALDAVKQKLSSLDQIEARYAEIGDSGEDGTRLFDALQKTLSDVPADQIGGAIFITDGQVHDIPKDAAALQMPAPLHALITGYPNEADRRVRLVDPPRFGLVGKEQSLTIAVDDTVSNDPVALTIRRDGNVIATPFARPGSQFSLPITIDHGGANVIEIEVAAREDELTLVNNRAIAVIDGIRDKLRVLLVSGEPHPGERTWRNMLKSDPNVDLVHFTILRPPQKLDATPVNELSLIAFPTRELFEVKISEFDLIILDRYSDLVMMPPAYFRNMVKFVRDGGAMLIAAGPEFSGEMSIAETALQAILPAVPDGTSFDTPFLPKLTPNGSRHPVTRDLSGADPVDPKWGRWIRQISATQKGGMAVMSGVNDQPLLILNHEGEGRVALLLSDHAWLWARDFQGGGPHLDLLRRTGHWLMKEPDLEEEALRAQNDGKSLTVERQSMADKIDPVTITTPRGETSALILEEVAPGLWRGKRPVTETGLYKLQSGELTSFAAVGEANPREYRNVLSSTETLAPIAKDTAGSVRRLAETASSSTDIPDIVMLAAGTRYAGRDYIGIKRSDAATVEGVRLWPIFTGLIGLTLIAFGLLLGWLGERGFSTRRT